MYSTKKYLVIIFWISSLSACFNFAHAQFNGTKLGMNIDEVREIMGKELRKSEDGTGVETFVYEDKLDGMDVSLYFNFLNNKLVKNTVVFDGPYSTTQYYFFYYDRVNSLLAKKYGVAETVVRENDNPH